MEEVSKSEVFDFFLLARYGTVNISENSKTLRTVKVIAQALKMSQSKVSTRLGKAYHRLLLGINHRLNWNSLETSYLKA